MQGLLDFMKTPAGQGLLAGAAGYASGARRGTPVNNIGRGLLGGLVGYGAATDRELEMAQQAQMKELRDMQMQQARASLQENQAIKDAASRAFRTPEQAQSMSVGPMPDGSPLQFQPGFDQQMFLQNLAPIAPMKAMELEAEMRKQNAPVKLGAGETFYDPKTMKPLVTNTKAPELPSAVREYEFAKSQGYPGTFEQWSTSQKRAGASSVNVTTGQKGLENELKIRSDFRSEPIYKAHQDVQSAYSQISQSLKQASPAGDLAGATKLMKILDPGSVVRESELGMAMQASGLMDRVQNYAQNVLNGTKLTPTQRADFQRLADALFEESNKQYNAKRGEYAGFATDYGLNAERIVGPEAKGAPKAFSDMPPANPGNKGKILRDTQTGKSFVSNGMQWVEQR